MVEAFAFHPMTPFSRTLHRDVALAAVEEADSLPEVKRRKRSSGGGGRAPSLEDTLTSKADDDDDDEDDDNIDKNEIRTVNGWKAKPCEPGEARLTILQITDVYTLEHLASFKTLLEETRAKSKGSQVISMITVSFCVGRFLAFASLQSFPWLTHTLFLRTGRLSISVPFVVSGSRARNDECTQQNPDGLHYMGKS